jgi:DNA-binding beta-propeller fold protein YncE
VSVISGRRNKVTATIPVGNGPVGVAVNPLTGAVYTANIGDATVSVISG